MENTSEIFYQEKNIKIEKELKKSKEELKIKNDTISNLKNKNTKYFNSLKEVKEINTSLNNKIKELLQVNAEKDIIIKKMDTEIQALLDIKNTYNTIANKNNKLKEQIRQLNSQINNSKCIIDTIKNTDLNQLEILKLKKKIEFLEEQIVGCTNTNNALKEKYEEYFQEFDKFYNSKKYHQSANELIDQLQRNFTVTNSLSYSNIIQFGRRVERAIENRHQLNNINNEHCENNKEEIIFGYLIEENEDIKFISLEGRSYKVKNIPLVFRYNAPSKAVAYQDDTVIILYVYNEQEESFEKELNKTKKSIKNIPTNEELAQSIYKLNLFKVLIITGRKEKYYHEDLSKTGLQITTFNPFEENENELKNKIGSQDVIIVIQNAIPHRINNLLDRTDIKIQFVTRDNIRFILSRIKYSLIQQGLL